MDYKQKLIMNKTIEDLLEMKIKMYEDQYKYGYAIDKLLLWNINYTITELKKYRDA